MPSIPPLFEYKRPFRRPPDEVKKHSAGQTVPLEVRPVPAIRVLRLRSVGSKVRLEIESVACLSVRGVQVTPPLVVVQMPPPTVPTKSLFAFSGSAITGPIAPVTVPFGGASALPDRRPKAGAGPWVTKFWFTWTCANAAVGSANAVAMTSQRNGPNMIRPRRHRTSHRPGYIVPKELRNAIFELSFRLVFH
jgi:hypothetical protein